MNLAGYYRVLGLRMGADFESVKSSYRLLVRRYHPDVNPDSQQAKEKFIQITQAYQTIAAQIAPEERLSSLDTDPSVSETTRTVPVQSYSQDVPPAELAVPPKVQINPKLSKADQQLKQQSYEQLQSLFRSRRFPRAIALVEGLAQRMPHDQEVRQWQAITYQRWGRCLISQNQWRKAQPYLKKALRTDPHNKSLQRELQQDFQQLECIRKRDVSKAPS